MKLWRDFFGVMGVFFLYFASAILGFEYAVIGQTVTLMWPPSGIALAAVLILGYRIWPGIALGALFANAWNDHLALSSLSLITMGNTLEPLVGAFLLRKQKNFSIALDTTHDVLRLVLLAAFGSTVVGATFGTLGLLVGGNINFAHLVTTWDSWWLGDGMGVLVISPVILTGFSMIKASTTQLPAAETSPLEALILITALTATGVTIFRSSELAGLGYFHISLAMFPFVIWSALRLGSFGTASVALIASLLAIYGTVNGTGPFVLESKIDSMILWCLFADLMAITGLILAAVGTARNNALVALKMANEGLDKQVRERTRELLNANLELHGTLAERRRLQLEMEQISEDRQKMIGQELHDGIGQQLTGTAFLVSSLGQTLEARSAPEAGMVDKIRQQLNEALTIIRSLSHGLYPTALETGGLSCALYHLAEYVKSSSGIQCGAQCSTNGFEINKAIALNLYRIAQEAVCNALRHSKAQRIAIRLSEADGQYLLQVDDNGTGFPVDEINLGNTLGLRSMRSRANLIGAVIDFRQNLEGGMSIVVNGPCKPLGEDVADRR